MLGNLQHERDEWIKQVCSEVLGGLGVVGPDLVMCIREDPRLAEAKLHDEPLMLVPGAMDGKLDCPDDHVTQPLCAADTSNGRSAAAWKGAAFANESSQAGLARGPPIVSRLPWAAYRHGSRSGFVRKFRQADPSRVAHTWGVPQGAPSPDFRNVDAVRDGSSLVAFLQNANADPQVEAWRALADPWLRQRPGDRLLDVGSGDGHWVREAARALGPEAVVVGVEPSRTMIQATLNAGQTVNASGSFAYGVAEALPFANDSFDAVRCERVLIHVHNVFQCVREMARVTRPNGVVVAIEPDWDSFEISGIDADLVRSVLEDSLPRLGESLSVGACLADLFKSAGLERIRTHRIDLEWRARTGHRYAFLHPQIASGLVSSENWDEWFSQLSRLEKADKFRMRLTGHAAGGWRTPPSTPITNTIRSWP